MTAVVPVKEVVMHQRPHLDELAGLWAAQRFPHPKLPAIIDAKIVPFCPSIHCDGRSEDKWRADGVVFLGVRGGRYDDHPHERFPNDCTFTLVLKDLGIDTDPALQELKRHVLMEDRNGAPHPLHLACLVKRMHKILGLPDIYARVQLDLEALYMDQVSFLEARAIVARSRFVSVVHKATGCVFHLCIVESDNEDVHRAAREARGANAALVVQRKGSGHVLIVGNHRLGVVSLSELAGDVRELEQRRRGDVRVRDRRLLCADGVLPEVPEWYHHEAAGQLLNGSLTQPDVPATCILLGDLESLCTHFLHFATIRSRGQSH